MRAAPYMSVVTGEQIGLHARFRLLLDPPCQLTSGPGRTMVTQRARILAAFLTAVTRTGS